MAGTQWWQQFCSSSPLHTHLFAGKATFSFLQSNKDSVLFQQFFHRNDNCLRHCLHLRLTTTTTTMHLPFAAAEIA
jgi:hypothetical protein